MITQWKQVQNQDGCSRYKATNRRADAWIQRHSDGSADYGAKNGFLGLGLHTQGTHVAPAPSDQVLLSKLDESANPPRFSQWSKLDKTTPGTTYYQGESNDYFHSDVNVSITRAGDVAEVKGKTGVFGLTHFEGTYFAPAPSDAEILKSISRKP